MVLHSHLHAVHIFLLVLPLPIQRTGNGNQLADALRVFLPHNYCAQDNSQLHCGQDSPRLPPGQTRNHCHGLLRLLWTGARPDVLLLCDGHDCAAFLVYSCFLHLRHKYYRHNLCAETGRAHPITHKCEQFYEAVALSHEGHLSLLLLKPYHWNVLYVSGWYKLELQLDDSLWNLTFWLG